MQHADFSWVQTPATQAVVAALGAGNIRFVGGAVRDSLLSFEVKDIDIATPLLPAEVMRRAQDAGLKAVPTGFDHGTITLVSQHQPFEVTTLRQDVSTDGRRATIAFTDDWQADAARRDFTINALYLSPALDIFDYFGGRDDLARRVVRFIGDAEQRIREDALRILRFFRFSARYANLPLDAEGLRACTLRARDMMALSRERIRDELLKLLGADDPLPVLKTMREAGMFETFLPEVTSLAALTQLVAQEKNLRVCDAFRRLAALLPADAALADALAARFKLSTAQRKRLVASAERRAPQSAQEMRAAIYWHGKDVAVDRLLLGTAAAPPALIALAQHWQAPKLPVSGKDLIAAGLLPGPAVSAALLKLERAWAAQDFPDDTANMESLVRASVVQSLPDL